MSVSVIITSYNRFDSLLDTIKSIRLQSHPVYEIIVVNDASTDPRYKTVEIPGVIMIHNEINSKDEYGFINLGANRNKAMAIAKGEFFAMCDDDDLWLPNKIEIQIRRMMNDRTKFCSTEGYYCETPWDSNNLEYELYTEFQRRYPLYNSQHFWWRLKELFGGIDRFPEIWKADFLYKHNGVILSSAIFHRSVLDVVGSFSNVDTRAAINEDYELWRRIILKYPLSYVSEPCFAWGAYAFKRH